MKHQQAKKNQSFCEVITTKLKNKPVLFLLINILLTSQNTVRLVSTVVVENPRGLPSEVVYGFKTIDFNFKSPEHRQEMIDEKKYIVDHVGIAGVKISGDRMFITIGRFIPGVPVTLAVLPYNFFNVSDFDGTLPNGPPLTPWPSWEMQEVGNCDAFQLVQSVEIDQFNRLWAIDMGKSDIMGTIRTDCPAKLMIYDLNNKADRLIRKFEFPPDIIPLADGAPIEIVVGCLSWGDCKVYIGDIYKSSLIIYSFRDNFSWKVVHRKSMEREQGSEKFTLFGKPFQLQLGIDGMALSPKNRNFDTLYYTPLAGYTTYSVPTAALDWARQNNITDLPDSSVTIVAHRFSITDGFAMDSKGRLFWGAIEYNSIYSLKTPVDRSVINSNGRIVLHEKLVAKNDEDLIWSDTLGFDQRGYLFVVANAFHLAPLNYDRNKINFKIVRIFVGSQSYVYDT